jgi:hypothetical protein
MPATEVSFGLQYCPLSRGIGVQKLEADTGSNLGSDSLLMQFEAYLEL